jgi:hypothetical protein
MICESRIPSWLDQQLDAAVNSTSLDVADGLRIGCNQLSHLEAVGYGLRRLPGAAVLGTFKKLVA